MYFNTYYKSQKEHIAGSISLENGDAIHSGRSACHCVCNCFCSCACFNHALNGDEFNTEKIDFSTEEYLSRLLTSQN